MNLSRYRHPILFYGLAVAIPWVVWFIAGYISHITPTTRLNTILVSILGIVGLISPMIVAFVLIFRDKVLRRDFLGRLFNFKNIKPVYIVIAVGLMPASLLLAQAISLLFGYSADQFRLAGTISFTAGIYPAWFILLLAPVLEELAWHSYGTDSLRARYRLFTTSLIFGLIWFAWHVPLGFIKGYYQSNVAASGLLYSLNFALSIIPFVLLINWLYYKTNRSIWLVIVFHASANFFNELFMTHPDSKVIQTIIISLFTLVVVIKDRKMFFRLNHRDTKTSVPVSN